MSNSDELFSCYLEIMNLRILDVSITPIVQYLATLPKLLE